MPDDPFLAYLVIKFVAICAAAFVAGFLGFLN